MSAISDDSRFYIEGMCTQLSIPFRVFAIKNLREQMETWLNEFPCKVVLSLTFPYKIPKSVLAIPELGFINFHFAMLPEYRGASPVFWQIKNHEPYGGITLHKMDENLDTGAVLTTRKLPIDSDETYGMHWSKLSVEGGLIIPELLKMIDSGKPIPGQTQTGGNYYPKPTYRDVKLDWHKNSSDELLATIKACNPWNKGAFTFLNGKEIRIVEATVSDVFYDGSFGVPGSVQVAPDRLTFAINCIDSKYLKPEIIYTDEGFITPASLLSQGIKQDDKFH
jgi:methionyl-tRNA formyltransferase